MRKYEKRLYPLRELGNYVVAEEDPDVRGWDLADYEGNRLGEVAELIVDPEAERVRYLNVLLDKKFSHANGERHLLIPIGRVRIREDKDEIILSGVDKEKLLDCPVYKGPEVSFDYEHALVERLHPEPGKIARNPEDFYNSDYFNDEGFYGPRRTVNPSQDV